MTPLAEEMLKLGAEGEELCSNFEQNARRKGQLSGIQRLMAFAVAQGRSRIDLAEDTGYGFEQIVEITERKEFKEVVDGFIVEQGEDLVTKRLDAALVDSVQVLIELMHNPATKDMVKLQSAIHILNRSRGTPTQHIITEKKSSLDPLQEMEGIEAQLSQLHEETKKHKKEYVNANKSNPNNAPVAGEGQACIRVAD